MRVESVAQDNNHEVTEQFGESFMMIATIEMGQGNQCARPCLS